MPAPLPGPPLDGVPPSPPNLNAGPAPAGMAGQAQEMDSSGSLQLYQLGLELGADIAKRLDLLAQAFPQLMPLIGSMQSQLKAALRSTLQQGFSTPESSPSQMSMPPPAAMQGMGMQGMGMRGRSMDQVGG